jgi:type II secretory pathway component GspD/PulD (secretin)
MRVKLPVILFILFFTVLAFAQNKVADDKISLDIKGMDIVDVLKMLSTRSGMNMVIGKNVSGKVTLFLKDVSMWDAFEIIVLANDLAYEKSGEIINVMTQRDYELQYGERFQGKTIAKTIPLKYAKATDLSKALSQIKTNIGKIVIDEGSNTLVLIDTPEKIKEMEDFIKAADLPVQTKVFGLNYAQADKLSVKIQENLTKGIGYLRIDERTNKIAVTDFPEKLDEIARIINAFDEKTPQVLIDAQIIEIKPSDKFEMGVDWDFWIKNNFRMSAALPIGTTNRLLLGAISSTPSAKGDYKAIIDLLRTIGDTKILSSPRIMALNNQEAKILVGTKDAYITSTTSQAGSGSTVTSQSVNFVDVGIKLFVTPTINKDGFVTMKIRPEISSATRTDLTSEGKITQVPIVTTSETETTVMVKDGITVIIGGLRKDERYKTVKKIPVAGDIPLLGFFFRSTTDEVKNTELVILLTPHIMSGESPYTDFASIRPKEGVVAKMVRGNIVTEVISDSSLLKESALDYYRLIVDKINITASSDNQKGEKGKIEIIFVLNSNGELKGEPEIASSDNQAINRMAVECIKKSSPFPPFPYNLKKMEEETFRIYLEYK